MASDTIILHWATSSALGHLRDPQPDAAKLMVAKYDELSESYRASILKALGEVEQPSQEIIGLWLKALKQKSREATPIAAANLGNPAKIKNHDLNQIVDALLAAVIDGFEEAAEALANLASDIASNNRTQGKPVDIARVLSISTSRKLT